MNVFEKFQSLINDQKEKQDFLQSLLDGRLPKIEGHKVRFSLDFRRDNLIVLKILEKSSTKNYIKQGEGEIVDAFKQKFPEAILKII